MGRTEIDLGYGDPCSQLQVAIAHLNFPCFPKGQHIHFLGYADLWRKVF